MRALTIHHKIYLSIIEGLSVFAVVFLNQMITTVFPAYASVQSAITNDSIVPYERLSNCTMDNPSNVYVAILIGSKYCTELIMLPIVGWFSDRYNPAIILFCGNLVEALACIIYSTSGSFYVTIFARIIDAIGYSTVSTSGLTLIYTIYLKEKSRNKLITIDSILVYIAISVSPLVAGGIFETVTKISEETARIATFMMVCPVFLILALGISPFAFENSVLAKLLNLCENVEPSQGKQKILKPFIKNNPNMINIQQDLPPEIDNQIVKSTKQESGDKNIEVQFEESLSIVTLIKDYHILIVVIGLLFNSLIGNSLETTLPIFMIRKFCSDQKEQGIVWLFGFLSLMGFFLSSVLFHIKPQICWTLPLIGLFFNGMISICVYFSNPWWVVGICLGFLSFFSSISEVILIPVIPKIIDAKYTKSYGSGSGLTLLTFTISGIIGSFPVGPLVERFGFLSICIVLCSFNLFCAPFIYFLRKYFN